MCTVGRAIEYGDPQERQAGEDFLNLLKGVEKETREAWDANNKINSLASSEGMREMLEMLRELVVATKENGKVNVYDRGLLMVLLLPKWIKIRRDSPILQKAQRDRSKLTPKVIIDKNGHKKTVYVRMGIPEKKVNRVAVEKDSTEQAHKLTLDMFGTPEEVQKMALMERNASTREEARGILVELTNKPLNSKAGVEATVSKNSIEKILSGKSANKSYDAKAHF